jgi:hypothetical protein
MQDSRFMTLLPRNKNYFSDLGSRKARGKGSICVIKDIIIMLVIEFVPIYIIVASGSYGVLRHWKELPQSEALWIYAGVAYAHF